MQLDTLTLNNFRNYEKSHIKFSAQINLIKGLNAQGKTNLLEAIYLLCLGRSFRLAKNQELIKEKKNYFKIQGLLQQDNQIQNEVIVNYVRDGRKEIQVDRKRLTMHSRVFGQFPVVIMAPDEFKVTAGSPTDRRRFLDILLSQLSLPYLSDLQEYNRVLKQRNKILHSLREGYHVSEAELAPWTETLVTVGARIIKARQIFISEFSQIVKPLYREVTGTNDLFKISISSAVPYNNEGSATAAFYEAIEKTKNKERRLGTSLIGPHRDDLVFTINDMDVRKYGSRGEHKSVLFTLKKAEFNFLYKKKGERPLLLLDDCLSELDHSREQGVFHSMHGLGQIFLTSPRQELQSKTFPFTESDKVTCFLVEEGKIESVKA